MGRNNIVGAWGEALAAEYLQKKKYKLLATGFRCRFGEIDLIVQNRQYLVFVEVKTRRLAWQCQPMDVLTPAKIRNIVMAADAYVRYKRLDMPVRYDLITVSGSTQNPHICHYEEAFYSPVWYR